MSDDSKSRDARIESVSREFANLADLVQTQPGGKTLITELSVYFGPSYSDARFVKNFGPCLDRLWRCHHTPVATIRYALSHGLQKLVDEALARTVDYDYRSGLIISQHEPVAVHHCGRVGSTKFLPVLVGMITDEDYETRRAGLGALSHMTLSYDKETSDAAIRVQFSLHTSALETRLENLKQGGPNCFGELGEIVRLANVDVVNEVSRRWREDYAQWIRDDEWDLLETFLRAFVELAALKAPGAREAIELYGPSFEECFTKLLARKPRIFDGMTLPEKMLLRTALLGVGLEELPGRVAPDDFPTSSGSWWIFREDYYFFLLFPKAVSCMETRGVQGAAEFALSLERGRERFLVKTLLGHLASESMADTYSEFEVPLFRKFLNWVSECGGVDSMHALDRLMVEPWRNFDYLEWRTSSSGQPYTENRVAAVQESLVPMMEAARLRVALRLGLAD